MKHLSLPRDWRRNVKIYILYMTTDKTMSDIASVYNMSVQNVSYIIRTMHGFVNESAL